MNRLRPAVLIAAIAVALVGTGVAAADDPGPHLQYGGTPIELHLDSPGANFTIVHAAGGPTCAIVSTRASRPVYGGTVDVPTVAMDCDWTPK